MSEKLTGIRCEIYKNATHGDCSLGGISSKADQVTLVDDNLAEIFDAAPDAPPVRLVRRTFYGGREYVHAVPAGPDAKHLTAYMHGGCFIESSDSRVNRVIDNGGYPIALHDRCES